jgi:osmotically-inducible protein OsmY
MSAQSTVQKEMLELNAEDLERAEQVSERLRAVETAYDELTVSSHKLKTELTEMSEYKKRYEV